MDYGASRPRRRGVAGGIILIVLGIVLLVQQLTQAEGEVFLVGLGAAFLIAYFLGRRLLGFAIAGTVLVAVGGYSTLEQTGNLPQSLEGSAFMLFLGTAFLVVYLLHTRADPVSARRNWPLVVGLVLWGVGALIFLIENAVLLPPEVWSVIMRWWPLLLIAFGVWFLLRRPKEERG